MWPFGKKTQAEARPALGRVGVPLLGTWPGNYDQQLRDALTTNPVAQRAVRLVVEGCVAAPLYGDGPQGEAIAALARGVVEAAAAHLLLHGNAFLQIGTDADGLPAALWALRPERVTVEPGANGWPVAYRYRAGETLSRIPAEDGAGRPGLIHVRGLGPGDDHYGLGCLAPAMGAVAIHNAATRWNKALLDNAARPSGALVYDPGEPGAALSPEQFDRLRGELEASFGGAANAGRPMLLEGGLKWQTLSLSPADMDFIGLKAAAARDIALAFGVPPMLLGLPGDNTYANYAEANRALWRQTILPMIGRLVDAINHGLRAWWPEARAAIDLDGVPALYADRGVLWAQVSAADFLTVNEKREMLGFGPMEAGNNAG